MTLIKETLLEKAGRVLDLLQSKLRSNVPDRVPLIRDFDPSLMTVSAQRELLDGMSPPYTIHEFDQNVATQGFVEIPFAGKFVWVMLGGNVANYMAFNRMPNASSPTLSSIPMSDGLFISAPFARLYYQVLTPSATRLRIMIGQTDFRPGNQAPTGGGLNVAFTQAQPVYLAATGGTTTQFTQTLPATPASDAVSIVNHFVNRNLARIGIRSTTLLGAGASLVGAIYATLTDMGYNAEAATSGQGCHYFGTVHLSTFSDVGSATNGCQVEVFIAGSASPRLLLAVTTAGVLLSRTRATSGAGRVRFTYVNNPTWAQAIFEHEGILTNSTVVAADV